MTPSSVSITSEISWRNATRTHLGVEIQRQWSDFAIIRTAPALLGLFSLITIWASHMADANGGRLRSRAAAWYRTKEPTFSDAIAEVRRVLCSPPDFSMSRILTDTVSMPMRLLERLDTSLFLAA